MKRISGFIIISLLAAGCAYFDMPTPKEIIKQPIGTITLRRGMSKDEVISKWGKPDSKKEYTTCDPMGICKEEWTYNARVGRSPFESNYFSKTQRLFFDGESLTNWTQDE